MAVQLSDRIIQFLSQPENAAGVKALAVAKAAVGPTATKKDVNPTLYEMQKRGAVDMIAGTTPPLWKQVGANTTGRCGTNIAVLEAAPRPFVPTRSDSGSSQGTELSALNSWAQQNGTAVEFVDESSEGPPHAQTFYSSVWVCDRVFDAGSGGSKQAAREAAAAIANERIINQYKLHDVSAKFMNLSIGCLTNH